MARILVSDDEPYVLRLVGLCLEQAGYDVVLTPDPCEVAEIARQSTFDAVILDVMMAPISGFDVLAELRRHDATSSLPVLFLSGRSGGEDRVRGLREGADDYLVKPFETEELVLRVDKLVAWGARRRGAADGAESDTPAPEAGALHFMGRYEVRGVIGRGTIGTVYEGWDPRLHRAVALKTIDLEVIATESQRLEMLDRLRNEAITVAKFNHPNIVTVYDLGDTEGSAFIAMELVEGVSLADYLARVGRVDAGQLIPLGLGMARALETAHKKHIIHRDLKPGNVLLGRDGSIKVTDFGLAAVYSQVAGESEQLGGTPGYVPPEALRMEPYTLSGDLYGLGSMLYEAAVGAHPFAGLNLRELIERTKTGNVVPLAERRPELPGELTRLVAELLSNEPDERPTAAEVVRRLEHLVRQDDLGWSAEDLPGDLFRN